MSSTKLRKRTKKGLIQLKPYLDQINDNVEKPDYITYDPVQFMHAFTDKKDMEIAGFLAALMAWGRRDIVVAKVEELLHRMDYQPYEFVKEYGPPDFNLFQTFKHRTFKPIDLHGIILSLKQIYSEFSDFEEFWKSCIVEANHQSRHFLAVFHHRFLNKSNDLVERTRKHISNPEKGSTCKRMWMYLRWCIRKNSPVDVGIWSLFPQSNLQIPFDVHVARQARKYGLLSRRSNDLKAVEELTDTLRILNPEDPARYDYALFGIGALNYELPLRFKLNKV